MTICQRCYKQYINKHIKHYLPGTKTWRYKEKAIPVQVWVCLNDL